MLEKLLELDDIALQPSTLNSASSVSPGSYNFGIQDEIDGSTTLPIFTTPSDTIVDKDNWSKFTKLGLRPTLSIIEDLQIRLEGCQYIFASFTLQEIQEYFLNRRAQGNGIFRILIDNNGNGHDTAILNVATNLKKAYGRQVEIIAGNITNPKTYIEYCKAGIDYVRVGMGEQQDMSTGFYYPLGSLLLDILGIKTTSCVGLKQTKIIADDRIMTSTNILKAIALGADYVMIGRPLAKTVEAAGGIYKTEKGPDGKSERVEINRGSVVDLAPADLQSMDLARLYTENTRGDWVKVNTNLSEWTKEVYQVFNYGFSRTGALGWKDFKANVKFGRVSD